MIRLPIRTWILNAAAVFSGRHGEVTRQAEEAGCSRETVYEHARKVEERLDFGAESDASAAFDEIQRLRRRVAELERSAENRTRLDTDVQRRFAVTAFAMGVSLRQTEDLLGVLLPEDKVPDHSTLGRWVAGAAERAGDVLAAIDPACAPRIQTLAIDEIFFGGDRPWSGLSRQA